MAQALAEECSLKGKNLLKKPTRIALCLNEDSFQPRRTNDIKTLVLERLAKKTTN